MSYWKNISSQSDSNNNLSEFYEFEPGVVLDVITDDSHPAFKEKIDIDNWPSDISGQKPNQTDLDYSWIGRILVRPLYSKKYVNKEETIWAIPIEKNISEFPLVNELVSIVRYDNFIFYTRKVNIKNFINENIDFRYELNYGNFIYNGARGGNKELYQNIPFVGKSSKTRLSGGFGFEGVAGRYFVVNKNIRSVKRHEGDLVIESRFGQSIKFGAYDDDRSKDNGKNSGYEQGGGNPYILIRNRQRPLVKVGEEKKIHKKLPAIKGTVQEKNAGGVIEENIHHDGSSIHITSGFTISNYVTTCYKTMFESGKEEQKAFSPPKSTNFKFPQKLDGDQIIIQSDRLIFSSRYSETFHFSKGRYGIVTDSEYTVDAHNQIVLTTNSKTVINSPVIYLGEYDQTGEPALLGQTTVNWLYELCTWLLNHTHWYKHSHPKTGAPNPLQTQLPVQNKKLEILRDSLHTLLSRRVFITGGGFAPGQNGENLKQ